MKTTYTSKKIKKVLLYIDDNLFKEMPLESFEGRYPTIRIGWRKPAKGFGIGNSYEQFYFKFEYTEIGKDGLPHYKLTDIEGLEVETTEDEKYIFPVPFINEGIG